MSPECPPPGRVTLSEVPETSEQALVLALYLGLAAPDDDKAQAAGILAEESAVGHRRVDRRALQSRRARAVRGRGAVAHRPPGVNRQTGRPGQAERGRVAAPSNPSRERGTGSSTAAASSPQAYSTACLPARDPATGRAGRASASVTTSNPATPERGWGSPLTTRDSRRVCHAPEYPGRFFHYSFSGCGSSLNHSTTGSAPAPKRGRVSSPLSRSIAAAWIERAWTSSPTHVIVAVTAGPVASPVDSFETPEKAAATRATPPPTRAASKVVGQARSKKADDDPGHLGDDQTQREREQDSGPGKE